MWVGSRGRLQFFASAQQQFQTPEWTDYLAGDDGAVDATALLATADGALWIGTQKGSIWRLATESGVPKEVVSAGQSLGQIRHLKSDRAGRIWVASDQGLTLLEDQGDSGYQSKPFPGNLDSQLGVPVFHVMEDRLGRFWVSTGDGLMQISLAMRIDGSPGIEASRLLAGTTVKRSWEDDAGNIWAATNVGLGTWSAQTRDWDFHEHEGSDEFSLSGTDVETLYRDRSGVLWIGTQGSGLSAFPMNTSQFGHISQKSKPGKGLNNNQVWAIFKDRDQDLWVGTKGGGLNRLRAADQSFSYYRFDPLQAGSISSDWIVSVHQDASGRLWIGTRGGGLNRFDGDVDGFTVFKHNPADPQSIAGDRVYSIAEHADGSLWLGTNNGVSRFDPESGNSRHYRSIEGNPASLSDSNVRSLLFGHDGRLWVGTRRGGLNWIDPTTGKMGRVIDILASEIILDIYQSADNTLWVASDRGLIALNPTDLSYRQFREADGLPNDVVYSILPGQDNSLWLATNQGISQLDPALLQFTNFDVRNGLTSNEFNLGASLAVDDGSLMFGTVAGITVFRPDNIVSDPIRPMTVITDFLIANEPVSLRRLAPNSPLGQHISVTKRLVLDYSDTVLTLKFSAQHYATPLRNRYAYRLLGMSEQWIYTDAGERSATFAGLSPGEYRFQVKAGNGDDLWQTEPTELVLEVSPPIWQTGWAVSVYVLLVLSLLAFVARIRMGKARDQERAQRIIAESEERLRLALWGSGDELWDWDLESGAVHRMNMIEIIARDENEGYDSLDDIGRNVHPEDVPALRASLDAHLEGRTSFYQAAYRHRHVEGGWAWLLERGQVVMLDSQGNPSRISGTTKVIDELKQAEASLQVLNDELEQRVMDRTRALREAYEELSATQNHLVEAEKMAALGNLVAGVAHELNTPIGIGLTAASHLQTQVGKLQEQLERLGHDSTISNHANQTLESAGLIISSLERAAKMVKSFKQVAVDQTIEERRQFDLAQYIDQILTSLRPRLKKAPQQVIVECTTGLMIDSYPGAFYQIISNFILNSLFHGFKDLEEGSIRITAEVEDSTTLVLTYRDDGHGMTEPVRSQVFEPFFTTERGKGGTGLGMHIVFNLVTQLFEGSIVCQSEPGKGVCFEMLLPDIVVDPNSEQALTG
jgi:ligand-binding sensor domain-containing protein/signal transduction histidine kinase